MAFFITEFNLQRDFRTRRQFGQHLCFGTAQNKRLYQFFQQLFCLLIAFFHRQSKAVIELFFATQQTRINEAEQIP